jgi:hypothetical protein
MSSLVIGAFKMRNADCGMRNENRSALRALRTVKPSA